MSVYKGYDPALTGGVAIADSVRASSTTWSSQKIGSELDQKAENSEFEAHTGDTDIHVTAQEREKWNAKQDKKTSLAGYGIEDAYTKDEVDAKLASTYKPAGTVADLAALPLPVEAKRGYVYNVASEFTTTADFLEGAGKTYPAGTNVAIVVKDDSNPQNVVYGYDAQAGFYDMSGFAKTADIQDDLDKAHEHENKTDVLDKLGVNNDGKLTLDGNVVSETADIDDELSDTSEKAVQNKVVKAALDDKVSGGDFIQYQEEVSNKPMIYGVMWTGSKKTKLTRIDDAAGLDDPVPYYSGMTEEYGSPFDTIMPWAGMERVTDAEAGELVKIPKFYYRFTQDGKVLKLQISNSKVAGFSVSPAHMDRGDGKGERDYVYIGRYHCAESTYKSTTGVSPQVRITRSAARTAIHNLGASIWQADFAMLLTIQLLYIVEFANWNSQTAIGGGCSQTTATSSAVFNMGNTDSMPYHTGTVSNSHSAYGVCQYRWIEGLWDNCLDWMDGCYHNSSGMSIILDPANFSDTANGTIIGTPTSGYPSALSVSTAVFPMFYPTTSSGSNTTYIPDNWGFGDSRSCLSHGGNYVQSQNYGLFCIYCDSASYSNGDIGCRLQKLP